MPNLTPGNRLYFYQLFTQELGIGKQTTLLRVEEVLAEADVLLEDVECESGARIRHHPAARRP